MELVFEPMQTVCDGEQPQLTHVWHESHTAYLFYMREERLKVRHLVLDKYQWGTATVSDEMDAGIDDNIEFIGKFKYLSRATGLMFYNHGDDLRQYQFPNRPDFMFFPKIEGQYQDPKFPGINTWYKDRHTKRWHKVIKTYRKENGTYVLKDYVRE